MTACAVSVVIPVLNAAKHLPALLPKLRSQQPFPPTEIVLVDSMSTDATRQLVAGDPDVRVIPIANFSHGRARNVGVREARGDIVVFMSQDAQPLDETWMANLIKPFEDQAVAAAYSRQVPYPDASPMECFFLNNHFPAGQGVRRMKDKDGKPAGFKSVFFSNVSSAARRSILLQYPFDETLIMCEDQQLSRDVINAGYVVTYAPDSVVLHSHNYTLSVVFKRYFDTVCALTEVFRSHGVGVSVSMGASYVPRELLFMVRNHPLTLPYYFFYNLAKTAGTIAGHMAPVMPKWILRKASLHSYHWK